MSIIGAGVAALIGGGLGANSFGIEDFAPAELKKTYGNLLKKEIYWPDSSELTAAKKALKDARPGGIAIGVFIGLAIYGLTEYFKSEPYENYKPTDSDELFKNYTPKSCE